MDRTRVLAVGVLAVVGCGGDHDPKPPAGDPDAAPAMTPDAAPADASVDASPPPFCDPSDRDLVGCYEFEPGLDPAIVVDGSFYKNDGTSAHVTSLAGVVGRGIGVDATSAVKVPDSASLDVPAAVTMELWVRVNALPAQRAALVDNSAQYGVSVALDGLVRCASGNGAYAAGKLAVGTWTHVACTANATSISIYVGGQLQGSTAVFATPATAPTDGMAIGHDSPSGANLDGSIDQVRIWRVVRTAAQICAAAGRTPC